MCGIAGIYQNKSVPLSIGRELLKLEKFIKPRGPDGRGIFISSDSLFGCVHRRLSIMDLSVAGAQPMWSANRRYLICYNGEIYNHLKLRDELQNSVSFEINWNGFSDTETIIECISIWGFRQTLKKLDGMYSIALWDSENRTLTLARDIFGEKPIYFGFVGSAFVFSSNLFGIFDVAKHRLQISEPALLEFLNFGSIAAPNTIYCDIFKLMPSSFITINYEDIRQKKLPVIFEYYSRHDVMAKDYVYRPEVMDFSLASSKVLEVISTSVEARRLADVSMGYSLSGGTDSALIASLAQLQSSAKIDTYTVGFEDKAFDESLQAAKIAQQIGTNHNTIMATSCDIETAFHDMSLAFDEPFADSSSLPTLILSKFVAEEKKLILGGDGADELFGGYNRHIYGSEIWKVFSRIPVSFRYRAFKVLDNLTRILKCFSGDLSSTQIRQIKDKIIKFQNSLVSHSYEEFHLILTASELLVNDFSCISRSISSRTDIGKLNESQNEPLLSMAIDTLSFLPDHVLTKIDRSTMFFGLEARSPFLQKEIFELSWMLPLDYKIKDRIGKTILKNLLYNIIGADHAQISKNGFTPPLSGWLSGPLKNMRNQFLSSESLKHSGIYTILRKNNLPFRGSDLIIDNSISIWRILAYQNWYFSENRKSLRV